VSRIFLSFSGVTVKLLRILFTSVWCIAAPLHLKHTCAWLLINLL
jgi:hypothetical protein